MRVQTGRALSRRCVLWLNDRDYIDASPHDQLPQGEVIVEYVLDGFAKGRVAMSHHGAMMLQLGMLRGELSAWQVLNEQIIGEKRWPAPLVEFKEQV